MRRRTRALALGLLALAVLDVAGCGRRILGFGPSRDGLLLVRHTEDRPLDIWLGNRRLGTAPSGAVTCFEDLRTGSNRLRATSVADTTTVRATAIVVAPDQPLLWDVDHDQLLSGRAHARACGGD